MASAEQQSESLNIQPLVDSIPALIHTARSDGCIDYFNRPGLDYLGATLDDVTGWKWTAFVYPEDVDGIVARWRACLVSGENFEYEIRIRRANGEYRWHLVRGVPLRDEAGNIVKWYGVVTDIEDRKQAEDKIREHETELRQILDFAPWHVAVLGADGKAMYLNKAGLDYHGLTREAWQDYDPHGLIHPDDHNRILTGAGQAKLLGDQPFEIEARLVRKDGKYRWFLFRFNPLRDGKGRVTRWYVTATDIEDRKQTEERLQNENVALREEIDKASMFEEIVGTSPALQTVLSRISKVAPSDSTVLITGETGTGKELVARAIHRRSDRASRAFVSVNCAAIPRDLIASELFGHEKGAFTGATQQRLGRFELANGGTLFLDEVGELPAETQIALLRVLQEHEFERVGGTRPIRADVRVIAATNRDLQAAISARCFRSDLFYRLNVFPIEIPPLRERKEDIRLLVEYFIDRYARKAGKKITTIDKKTRRSLESYPWPGNIRELQNVIERSVIVCETENFSVDESWLSQQPPERKAEDQLYLSEKVAAQEKEIIEAALQECQGRVFGPSGAAAKLGIARSTLESKIRLLKINKNRFRA
jgi:formate hydrogenlyase transcriptional activator